MSFKNLTVLACTAILLLSTSAFADCTIDVAEIDKGLPTDYLAIKEILARKNYEVITSGQGRYTLTDSEVWCSETYSLFGRTNCQWFDTGLSITDNEGTSGYYNTKNYFYQLRRSFSTAKKEVALARLEAKIPSCEN